MYPYTHFWVMVDETVFEWKLGAEGSFSVTVALHLRAKGMADFGFNGPF